MGSERKGKLKQTLNHRIEDGTQGTRSQEQQEQYGFTLSLLGTLGRAALRLARGTC